MFTQYKVRTIHDSLIDTSCTTWIGFLENEIRYLKSAIKADYKVCHDVPC